MGPSAYFIDIKPVCDRSARNCKLRLYVLNIRVFNCYTSQFVSTKLHHNLFYDQLNCLDTVLNAKIRTKFGSCFAFRTFSIFQPYSLGKECEAHDYAVYIVMLMRRIRQTIQPAPEVEKNVVAVILIIFIIHV